MHHILKTFLGVSLATLRFVIAILSMVVYMIAYYVSSPIFGHNQDRAFRLRRHWIKFVGLPILNISIEKFGEVPKEGNYLYICNHRSFSDPVVILNYIDAFVIAKAEVAHYPIINKGAELTGVLWVKRSEKSSRSATRQLMIETLQKGRNILVYPEGTISTAQHPLPFNPGTFYSAAEYGFKILPIAVEYKDTSDLWVFPQFVRQALHQFSKWKIYARVKFGEPIFGTDGEQLKMVAEQWTKDSMLELQHNWSNARYF